MLTESAWDTLRKSLTDAGCYQTSSWRATAEGILWRMRTGSPWRDLPPEFGPWNTVYRRFNRWVRSGIIDIILELVEGVPDYRTAYIDGSYVRAHQHASGCAKTEESAIGPSRGGQTTKLHGVCDRRGQPVGIGITAGNVSDLAYAETIVEDLAEVFDEIVGDKGYDSDSFRLDILQGSSVPVIPIKANSSRPNPGFHKAKYKKRHRIENLFARLKHFRGIATRYDKLKLIFEGTVKMGLIAIWLGVTI